MADADGRDVDTNFQVTFDKKCVQVCQTDHFQQKKNSLLGELSGRMQPSQGYKDRRGLQITNKCKMLCTQYV